MKPNKRLQDTCRRLYGREGWLVPDGFYEQIWKTVQSTLGDERHPEDAVHERYKALMEFVVTAWNLGFIAGQQAEREVEAERERYS